MTVISRGSGDSGPRCFFLFSQPHLTAEPLEGNEAASAPAWSSASAEAAAALWAPCTAFPAERRLPPHCGPRRGRGQEGAPWSQDLWSSQ